MELALTLMNVDYLFITVSSEKFVKIRMDHMFVMNHVVMVELGMRISART